MCSDSEKPRDLQFVPKPSSEENDANPRSSDLQVSPGGLCSRNGRNWIRTNDLQVMRSPYPIQADFKAKKALPRAFFIVLRGLDSNQRPPGYEPDQIAASSGSVAGSTANGQVYPLQYLQRRRGSGGVGKRDFSGIT